MSQLYTVEMFRTIYAYSYDPHTGRRVNEREERVSYVITDLPHVTALSYKFKFPKNDVKIIRQAYSADTTVRNTRRDYYERVNAEPENLGSEDIEKPTDTVAAAISGDLSAALDTEAA